MGITELIRVMGVYGLAVAGLTYLGKRLVELLTSRDLEAFKATLERQTEEHRLTLQAQNDLAIERFKEELRRETQRHATTNEQRWMVAAELAGLVGEAIFTARMSCDATLPQECPAEIRDEAYLANRNLSRYYHRQRAWVDDAELRSKIEDFIKNIRLALYQRHEAAYDPEGWAKAIDRLEVQAEELRLQLEADLRKYAGWMPADEPSGAAGSEQ